MTAGSTGLGPRSPEIELLQRCCRSAIGRRSGLPLATGTVDWELFLSLVDRNRLWNAAAHAVSDPRAAAPAWVTQQAARARSQITMLNLRTLNTVRRVVPLLQSAQLDVVVIKGPTHQQLLFGTPFARVSTDLDLLVPADQITAALAILEAAGYVLPEECRSLWWRRFLGEQHLISTDPSLCMIDLHHRLQQPGCPAPRRLTEFLQASEVPVGSAGIPVPPRNSAWLLSCISVVKAMLHREPAGHYALEVAAFAEAATPGELRSFLAEARRQGLERTARYAMRAATAVLGQVPSDMTDADRAADAEAQELLECVLQPPTDSRSGQPHRRMLWLLCDGDDAISRSWNYAREAAWTIGSEICRRASRIGADPAGRQVSIPS